MTLAREIVGAAEKKYGNARYEDIDTIIASAEEWAGIIAEHVLKISTTIEAIPIVLCGVCGKGSKGLVFRHGDVSIRVCQECIDKWHKGAGGPFGTRQLYSVASPSEHPTDQP